MLVNAWAGAELDFLVTWHTQWGGGGGGAPPAPGSAMVVDELGVFYGGKLCHPSFCLCTCVLQTDCAREDVGGIETDIHIPAEDHSADAASAGIRRKYCVYCIGGWEGVEGGGVSLW